MSKLEIIEGHVLSEDGVAAIPIGVHTTPDAMGLGYPGIVYHPLENVRNGDMLTFSHAILLCHCGGIQGACGCEDSEPS